MKNKSVNNGRDALVEIVRVAEQKFQEIEDEGSAAIAYERGYVRGRLEVAKETLDVYDNMIKETKLEKTIELSDKALRFVIMAINSEIEKTRAAISKSKSEDKKAELNNDLAFLEAVVNDLSGK